MKNIAYAHKSDNKLKLYLFDQPDEVAMPGSFQALMMSRLDFSVIVTEIPPVHPSEMENLLTFKLRSLYPGDPETTVFDYKIIIKNKQRYAVLFITSKETVATYKELAYGKPLILPFPAINKMAKLYENDNCIFYFWHKDWIDITIYEKGVFTSSSAVKREKETFLDFLKIRNILPKNYNEYKNIFICLKSESPYIQEQSRDLFKETKHIRFTPAEDALSSLSKKTDYLFKKRKQTFLFYKKLKIEMLLLPLILIIALLFNKYIDNRAHYLINLKRTLNERIQIYRKVQEYTTKKNTLNELLAQKPADVFFMLSEISKIFGNRTKIHTFEFLTKERTIAVQNATNKRKIKEYHFIIKGITQVDTLQYIEIFRRNPYFKDVTIPNVSGNEFHMEGIFVKGDFYVDE
ncbi:MAG: hypothetical protein JXJ04_17225 [Spirochaetales bacterium]|nr:hypothetical protein [Spirochaetales bacterium]